VLIVDDNEANAETLAMVLRALGHDVRLAFDGIEGVQAAAAFHPHVVLLDIGMPRMNGYDVARHIRMQPWGREMKLVAMTGWGQEGDKRRSQDAGFDSHLVKPVDPAAVAALLDQHG
jgi:CheY-like chemotaxis protein